MNMKTSLVLTAAIAAFTTVGVTNADEWDKKTIVTIDAPVMVPHHVTLQPGTYVIKLDRSPSNRHIVRFYDSKGKKQITAVMAINDARVEPNWDGKSVFTFYEAPAGQPRAIRAWFYPGDTWGQEFIYPKKEAALIASYNKNATIQQDEEANLNVPPAPEETAAPAVAENEVDDKAVVQEENKQVAVNEPTPEPAPAPTPVETAPQQQDNSIIAQNTPPPAPAVTTTPAEPPPAELPKTASNVPMVALIGFISLFAACGSALLSRA
jgi:hypothetical protein